MARRTLFLSLGWLLAAAPASWGSQLLLNFDECAGGGGTANKNVDCSSTSSNLVLVASVVSSRSFAGVLADLGMVDVLVGPGAGAMPPFWQFQTGGCAGPSRFACSANFSGNPRCADLWGGGADGGWQYGGATGPKPDGNRARVKWTWAMFPDSPVALEAGVETYVCKLTFKMNHASSCSGCSTPVCAVYVEEKLTLISGREEILNAADPGLAVATTNNASHCTVARSRQTTWGKLKSLYR